MGQGIAIALAAAGQRVVLLARRPHPIPPPLTLARGPWREATRDASVILVATPDDAIPDAARLLLDQGAVRASHAVLHLSGLLDRRALAPLEITGAALGSFHPLQTVADPHTAAARLAGAWAGIEGDPAALEAASRLASRLGMHAVRLEPESKPLYHAGAVMLGNYSVALAAVAERLARAAGIAPELAGRIYLPLLAGVVDNLRSMGTAPALTGPVRRGDIGTVRSHLAALPADAISLYRLLALEALGLAREQGLAPAAADPLARLLEGLPPAV
jgi:predicted short-subunit dehydrogenase-like oxidoreductase (DUF2520 family)